MKRKETGKKPGQKIICRNKRAYRDYFISNTYEAGIALVGSEVKSLRDGRANLSGDAYAEVKGGELFLVNCHITEYPWANQFNHEPLRIRKLLMHKEEIRKLAVKQLERGYTIIPLQIYFVKGKVKVELGLAKGKRQYDKRAAVRERDQDREMEAFTKRTHE